MKEKSQDRQLFWSLAASDAFGIKCDRVVEYTEYSQYTIYILKMGHYVLEALITFSFVNVVMDKLEDENHLE